MTVKFNYTEDEQKTIARWCDEAVRRYRDSVEIFGKEPAIAQDDVSSQIRAALAVKFSNVRQDL